MAVSESDRHDLYRGLEEKLGKRRAETFMNLVTSVPWTEVATKSDLADLRAATKEDLGKLRADMEKALRGQLLAFITVVAVLNGLIFAGLRFL